MSGRYLDEKYFRIFNSNLIIFLQVIMEIVYLFLFKGYDCVGELFFKLGIMFGFPNNGSRIFNFYLTRRMHSFVTDYN